MKVTIPRLALFAVLVSLVVLYITDSPRLYIANAIDGHFQEVSQPLVGLSVSLIIFPIITVPLVGDIVLKTRSLGIKVNKNLVKDYVNGCFTVFTVSVVELIMVLLKPFINYCIIDYLLISFLSALIVILVVLMLSLWKIVRLLYEVIATQ